ncbi:MAG: gliding motility-associated C-terminal domain-containing protein [Saprospiraceae bacterium]|nr:gliding motility-associated C-terminal domain-containing protein [Saprospiraceae bacterium]MCB9321142.1 gliding motility-associated C-terminal domain-containing protein [Lewinellaceae bacterium]
MGRRYTLLVYVLFLSLWAKAQLPTVNMQLGCGTVQVGDIICIPVTISAVDGIVASEFTIAYNQLEFEFVSINNPHPDFDQPLVVNPIQSFGRVKVAWTAPDIVNGSTFQNNDVLFEVCLRAKAPGSYPIDFIKSGEPLFLAYGPAGTEIIPMVQGCSIQVTPASTLDAFFQACYNTGNMQGTVTVVGFGGTPPYNVNWTGPKDSSGIINNPGDTLRIGKLPQGTYTFHIVDASGADSIKIIDLPNPTSGGDLEARIDGHDPTCFGDSNGSLSLTILGGSPPQFLVEWSTGEINSRSLSGLTAGTYSVTVTDINGCTASHSSTIGKDPIQYVPIRNDSATCLGLSDGYLQVAGTGGNSTNGFYDFEWIGGTPVSNPRGSITIRDAEPGLYKIRISDGVCEDTFDINVGAKIDFELTAIYDTISCFGMDDGGVTLGLVPIKGTPTGSISYLIKYPLGQTSTNSNTFNNLYGGTYVAYAFDDAGCRDSLVFNMPEPAFLDTTHVDIIGESCTSPGNGEIRLFMQGGTMPYNYLWSNNSTSMNASGLNEGQYSVTVTDVKGCESTFGPFDVTRDRVDFTIDTTKNISCPGGNDGALAVVTGPGVTIDNLTWNTGATSNTIQNLTPGTYRVTVNAGGCMSTDSVLLAGPPMMSHSFITTEPSCAGESNGSLSIQVTGGTGPYSYSWSNPNGTNNPLLPAIPAGAYTVSVTDANNCPVYTADTVLSEPAAMILTFAEPDSTSCAGTLDGGVRVFVTNGLPAYNYLWDNGSTSDHPMNLSGGWHRVSITDAMNCRQLDSFQILSPDSIRLDLANSLITDVTCNGLANGSATIAIQGGKPGYSVLWPASSTIGTSLTNVAAGRYKALVRDANDCRDSLFVTIQQPDSLIVGVDASATTGETCADQNNGRIALTITGGNPGNRTIVWSNGLTDAEIATGLDTGLYVVTVTDSRGCTDMLSYHLDGPLPLSLAFASIDSIPCFGDKTLVEFANVTGGNEPTNYMYSVNGAPPVETTNGASLGAGTYSIRVTDKLGCFLDTTLVLVEPAEIQIDHGGDIVIDLGDSLVLTPVVTGMFPIVDYVWDPMDELNCTTQDCSSVLLAPSTNRTYTLIVTDATGCMQTASIPVSVRLIRHVFIPNAFSPNDDGRNDLFQVFTGTGVTAINSMRVFDRWGNVLFDRENLTPSFGGTEGWDGRVNNRVMNPGVYVYVVDVTFRDGARIKYRGDVTLIR